MTLAPPIGRPDYRLDLTRWNRAGLTRFQYVDGNAPVWLEELRLGMLALYLRGIDPEEREPEKWRELFMKPVSEWDLPGPMQRYADAVAWAELLPAVPAKPENASARNRRLLDQYARAPSEYGWEIMRAFARAAHVLLGHADAYANEGYLRTRDAVGQSAQARRDGELPAGAAGFRHGDRGASGRARHRRHRDRARPRHEVCPAGGRRTADLRDAETGRGA